MNTRAFHDESLAPQPVDFVDFKWLMASVGHRVDAQRMQRDDAYARQCLALARTSTLQVLRELSERLQQSDAALKPR
jgi:hypothetical protein